MLRDITDTAYSGGQVLVHCQHGLHRTGAIITIWIAMALAIGDSTQSEQSVLSNTPWCQQLEEAFGIWPQGQQLDPASLEGHSRRDYSFESWNEVVRNFEHMPDDLVMEWIYNLRRLAKQAHGRQQTSSRAAAAD